MTTFIDGGFSIFNKCYFMRKLIICFLLFFQFVGKSQTVINSGNVSGNWSKGNSPYLINGDIVIPADSVLKIDAGVTIEFAGNYGFTINGAILANGSKSDSIWFTSSGSLTWKGLSFTSSSSSISNIKYSVIENAKKERGGGVYINTQVKLAIENCLFQKCFGRYGGGIYVELDINGNVLVKNTVFRNNTSYALGGGGAIYLNTCASKFVGCLIHDNYSEWGSAALASIGQGYSPEFINCTICDNTNQNQLTYVIDLGTDIRFENSIIYYNSPEGILVESEAYKPEFINCNISQEPKVTTDTKWPTFEGIFENNIVNVAPGFVDRDSRNYNLGVSHCINEGNLETDISNYNTDLSGNPRIYSEANGRIDIGALEYQGVTPNRTPVIQSKKEYYLPNLTASKLSFIYHDNDSEDVHKIDAYCSDGSVDVNPTKIDEKKFVLEIYPVGMVNGDKWVYIDIDDQTGTENGILRDSVLVHFANHFEGEVSNYIELRDSVKIIGDIVVKSGGQLVIKPGTYLEFQGDYEIDNFGDIQLQGTSDQPIVFNASDTTYYYEESGVKTYVRKNGWGGLIYHNRQDATISFVEIRNTSEGAIQLRDCKNIAIKNTGFYNCVANWEGNAGVLFDNSTGLVDSCLFMYGTVATYNTGVYVSSVGSDVMVSNSYFGENINSNDHDWDESGILSKEWNISVKNNVLEETNFTYGIYIIADSVSVIEDNLFSNNVSHYLLEVLADTCLIRGNKFISNNSRALLARITDIYVINNLFAYNKYECNCYYVNAIVELTDAGEGNTARVINNTFYGNELDSPYGYAVYSSYPGEAVNNIFWHNEPYQIKWGSSSRSDARVIENNVIEGNYGEGNFDIDPEFLLTDSLDFRLSDESYCIDKGLEIDPGLLPELDIAGNPRINEGTNKIDIGAYEYYNVTGVKNSYLGNLEIYPNPVSTEINISNKSMNAISEVRLYSLNGELKIVSEPNKYWTKLNLSSLNSGMYLLQVRTDQEVYRTMVTKF